MAEQKLVSLKKEFGEQYSEVQKVSGQVEDLKTKIKDRVNGILLGLQARVASLKQGLDILTQEVESANRQTSNWQPRLALISMPSASWMNSSASSRRLT